MPPPLHFPATHFPALTGLGRAWAEWAGPSGPVRFRFLSHEYGRRRRRGCGCIRVVVVVVAAAKPLGSHKVPDPLPAVAGWGGTGGGGAGGVAGLGRST
jgi:hypothetical protein